MKKVIRNPSYDLSERPFMIIWEVTQACDLACKHCRAKAMPENHPDELTIDEGKRLLEQIKDFGLPRPLLVFTGGDPFKRTDLFEIIEYGHELGLAMAVSPSGTPLLTKQRLLRAKQSGIKAVSLSIDGPAPESHDAFRRVPGSFQLTEDGWQAANEVGLKVQINTTVTRHNLHLLPELFELIMKRKVMTWSVFFLVSVGRGKMEDDISPAEYEAVMHFLYDCSRYASIKTTEGHQYKRVVVQRTILEGHKNSDQYVYCRTLKMSGSPRQAMLASNTGQHILPAENGQKRLALVNSDPVFPLAGSIENIDPVYFELREKLEKIIEQRGFIPRPHMRRAPLHINAGRGFVFISHRGEVHPSGFLPLSGGNVREQSLKEIYQDSPLFCSLRDEDRFHDTCGECEFRKLCGGSRSRAYAQTGDVLSEDPSCNYAPGSFPYPEEIEAFLSSHT